MQSPLAEVALFITLQLFITWLLTSFIHDQGSSKLKVYTDFIWIHKYFWQPYRHCLIFAVGLCIKDVILPRLFSSSRRFTQQYHDDPIASHRRKKTTPTVYHIQLVLKTKIRNVYKIVTMEEAGVRNTTILKFVALHFVFFYVIR